MKHMCMLPTIEKVGDKFPDNVKSADYFVVIPERAKWMGIGMHLIDEYEEETGNDVGRQ